MTEDSQRRRRRMIGIGFVLAFALSTATIIYTGLNVRAPGSASATGSSSPAANDSAPGQRAAESDRPSGNEHSAEPQREEQRVRDAESDAAAPGLTEAIDETAAH